MNKKSLFLIIFLFVILKINLFGQGEGELMRVFLDKIQLISMTMENKLVSVIDKLDSSFDIEGIDFPLGIQKEEIDKIVSFFETIMKNKNVEVKKAAANLLKKFFSKLSDFISNGDEAGMEGLDNLKKLLKQLEDIINI